MHQQSANAARQPNTAMGRAVLSHIPVLMLACAGLAAYANGFAGVFLFDDYGSILDDTRLAGLSPFLAHLPGMLRPLLRATFLADRMLWGTNPIGYHAINLALHLGCGLLLYAIVKQLAETAKAASGDKIAFVAALLFLVHPLGTETVTYLSGRSSGLAAFFYLSGVLSYLRASRPDAAGFRQYIGAAGCFALALAAKETAITFPLALLLVEIVIRGARGIALREIVLVRLAPVWAVLIALAAVAAFYARYRNLAGDALRVESVFDHLIAQVHAIVYALMLFVAPGAMNFDHDFAQHSLFAWTTLLSLLVIAGPIVLAFRQAHRQPLFAFGIAWFFLHLLPANSVFQRPDLLSERNLYLPAAGIFIAFASAWFTAERRATGWLSRNRVNAAPAAVRAFGAALAVVIALFAAETVARNALYSDPVAFWSDAASKSPLKARPHVNLGHAYFLAGDVARATGEFRRALELDPDNPAAQKNLRAVWDGSQ